MAVAFPTRNQPLGELNMTPLIDVLLVILVMLILSVPLGSHSLQYDLPGKGPRVGINDMRNRITIDAGDRLRWNGTPVAEAGLMAVLRRVAAMEPEPQVEFAPDAAASYRASARVLQLGKASGVTNFGFVDNEKYRVFNAG
jgi:biopolymer transport protein ExbD